MISFRNINSNVMTTLRLVFRVSQVQGYTENFVQDFLRTGFKAMLNGKPIIVPQYGEISSIILLGMRDSYKKKKKVNNSVILTIFCFLYSGASGKSFYEIDNDLSKQNVIILLII